jgi:hypothetical protein
VPESLSNLGPIGAKNGALTLVQRWNVVLPTFPGLPQYDAPGINKLCQWRGVIYTTRFLHTPVSIFEGPTEFS